MAKKITVAGKSTRRIDVSGEPQRRIEAEEFAAALGAETVDQAHAQNLDPVSLAALGSELIKRLRSSGGRPSLADATEICRVPLSAEDVKALEGMVSQVEASSGAKPSVGQLVSVIVRTHLRGLNAAPILDADANAIESEQSSSVSKVKLQQMIEEQIRPLREQVRRLEDAFLAAGRNGDPR